MSGKLNPGSPEAIEAGCICPVMDNNHGRGVYIGENEHPIFWQNMDCPVHGTKIHGMKNNGDKNVKTNYFNNLPYRVRNWISSKTSPNQKIQKS